MTLHSLRIKNRLNRFNCCAEDAHYYSKEDLEDALEGVDQARDIAEVNNELKPFRILGLAAQSALTISIISTAVSFYMVIFSLYSSNASTVSAAILGAA